MLRVELGTRLAVLTKRTLDAIQEGNRPGVKKSVRKTAPLFLSPGMLSLLSLIVIGEKRRASHRF